MPTSYIQANAEAATPCALADALVLTAAVPEEDRPPTPTKLRIKFLIPAIDVGGSPHTSAGACDGASGRAAA